MNTRFFLSAYT